MKKSSNETTSSIIPTKYVAIGIVLFLFATIPLVVYSERWYLLLLPLATMCLTGALVDFFSGLILFFVILLWTCAIFSVTYIWLKYWLLLGVYSPLLIIFYRYSLDGSPSPTFLKLQYLFWDAPLLIWINICSILGLRALEPFYSQITPNVAIGSLPLSSDVEFLITKGVTAVVNLCREYEGPLSMYEKYQISHIHLPTADLFEPSLNDMHKAIHFIESHLKSNSNRDKLFLDASASQIEKKEVSGSSPKVFIHCKGGRGRAVITTLCYLVHSGYSLGDAMTLIKEKRPVASGSVKHCKVIRALMNEQNT